MFATSPRVTPRRILDTVGATSVCVRSAETMNAEVMLDRERQRILLASIEWSVSDGGPCV